MAHWRALPNPILTLALRDWVEDSDAALRRVQAAPAGGCRWHRKLAAICAPSRAADRGTGGAVRNAIAF